MGASVFPRVYHHRADRMGDHPLRSVVAVVITITLAGEPVGKGRPKFSRASGRAYTPAKTANTEAFVKSEAVRQAGQALLEGPLRLNVLAVVSIPASWSKKKQVAALAGEIRPTGKPDLDNIAKLYADALNGILWKDDSQIVRMRLEKRYGAYPETVLTVGGVDEALD